MIGQVQIINGVKQIVPVTDTTPVDEVTVNNMQSVTSNAVARAIGSVSPEIVDDPTITDCNNAYILGKSVVYKISKTATNVPPVVSGQRGDEITLVSYTYNDSSVGETCYQIAYISLSNFNVLIYYRIGKPGVYWGSWEFLNNEKITEYTDANAAYEIRKTRVYVFPVIGATNLPPSTQGVSTWFITSNASSGSVVTQIAVGAGGTIISGNLTVSKAIYYRTGVYYNGGIQWSTWSALATKDDLTSKSSDKQGSWGILGGAAGSDKTNFVDLIRTLTGQNYGGGICGGSINTSTTSCGIPAGWYNFLYIPHRTGIGSDNYNYGNLLVFPMTQTNTYFYKIQMSGATILNAVRYSGTQL